MQRKNAVFTFISEPQPILGEAKDSANERKEKGNAKAIYFFSPECSLAFQLTIDNWKLFQLNKNSLFTFHFWLSIVHWKTIVNYQLSIINWIWLSIAKGLEEAAPISNRGWSEAEPSVEPFAEESRPRRGRHTRESAILNYPLSIVNWIWLSIFNYPLSIINWKTIVHCQRPRRGRSHQ